MEYFILIILGLIAGTIGSLVGLGGGIVIVPSLLFLSGFTGLFHHVTPQMAVGTSLFVIIFTGLSSTIAYMKYKTVDYKSGLLFLSDLDREALSAPMCQNISARIRFPSGLEYL